MTYRMLTVDGKWTAVDTILYPCTNHKTNKVEYYMSEGVHMRRPAENFRGTGRILPWNPVTYETLQELVEMCSQQSINGRREYLALEQRMESREEQQTLAEH
eukprot:comp17015_c2_seq2/m.15700 comp17015_c2_seq2/g.15700  ORF comp17015_c2_seq2/g.15700 comp17015_c2_seq2/m.15700 type:complete len:102 (-) comp17015_c2_seq2:67-372(-)